MDSSPQKQTGWDRGRGGGVPFPKTHVAHQPHCIWHNFQLFLFQAKELHTMLTDYQHVFYEKAMLAKKFTSLNAKLGGPELALLVKIRTMFLSPTSKVSNEKKGNEMMEFDLEALSGKRTLKWHFAGRLLDESGLYVCCWCLPCFVRSVQWFA